MGRALGLARGALLADVQGTLSGEGLWEGTAAIALVIVVDMVAEQPARALWGERRERKMRGGKGIEIMEEGKEEEEISLYVTTVKQSEWLLSQSPLTATKVYSAKMEMQKKRLVSKGRLYLQFISKTEEILTWQQNYLD